MMGGQESERAGHAPSPRPVAHPPFPQPLPPSFHSQGRDAVHGHRRRQAVLAGKLKSDFARMR